ncbi:YybH family protein [Desulfatitalea alkaliphila]|uniref:Nuclear transport factor 2 family protein n=1 Tax=Desulfatitalea alkaliphila TaxID=2929485 RepID=A0AA41R249_9BACT|nr:nuclear transport factor 2 family protein [Desulfatitalea alkaliphila]MCJ8500346.1 nuclear transport factor 2 family protein [Desulfatitalea alkaliphila]
MKPDLRPLRIGLKYCGGCRPNYDRVALARHIADRLGPGTVFESPRGADLDLVVAIHGCPTACADLSDCRAPTVLSVTGIAEAERVIARILTLTARKESDMQLSREAILKALDTWNDAWARYDLDGVMALMHDDVVFENWTGGRALGKAALAEAWRAWFAGGGFRFLQEELFVDETAQKVLFRWVLEWPCPTKGHEGRLERRKGVDVMHLKDGKIINKLTFSQTTVEIDGQRHAMRL